LSRINTEIIVAILSLLGTCFGSVLGILASGKLTSYRIEQLEKKVDKHNHVIDRLVLLEHDVKNLNKFSRHVSFSNASGADFVPDS